MISPTGGATAAVAAATSPTGSIPTNNSPTSTVLMSTSPTSTVPARPARAAAPGEGRRPC